MYVYYQSLSIRLIKQTIFFLVEIEIKLNGHIWFSKKKNIIYKFLLFSQRVLRKGKPNISCWHMKNEIWLSCCVRHTFILTLLRMVSAKFIISKWLRKIVFFASLVFFFSFHLFCIRTNAVKCDPNRKKYVSVENIIYLHKWK